MKFKKSQRLVPALPESQVKDRMLKVSISEASRDVVPDGKSLLASQLERIIKAKEVLRDVDEISLEKTLENFQLEANPEKEIVIWEAIAKTYQERIEELGLSRLKDKAEVFKVLVVASLCPTLDLAYECCPEMKASTVAAEIYRRFERNYAEMIAERQ